LNLQFNQIQTIPQLNEKDFNQLEVLNLSYNKLNYQCISNLYVCKKLKTLDLAANNFDQLPHDMFELSQLQDLNLSSNSFSSVQGNP